MSSQADQSLGNLGNDNAGSETLNAEVAGGTLKANKATENTTNAVGKEQEKDYIGSLPNNGGIGGTGVRDITTTEEENARAAQLGGDPDVAAVKP